MTTEQKATPEQAQEWAHPSVRGDADPFAEAKAAWRDGRLEVMDYAGAWFNWHAVAGGDAPAWSSKPSCYRRAAEPQQATRPAPPLPPAVKRIAPLPRAGLTQAELSDIFECFEGLSDQPVPKAPDGFDHIRAKYDFSRFRA